MLTASFQISSENQLDSKSGRILICHQKLGIESKEAGKARTLNSLVTEVDELLGGNDVGARDRFLATLIEYGYAKLPDYEANTWVLNKARLFQGGGRVSSNHERGSPSRSGGCSVQHQA